MIEVGSYWKNITEYGGGIYKVIGCFQGKVIAVRITDDKESTLVLTFATYSFKNYFKPLTPLEMELL